MTDPGKLFSEIETILIFTAILAAPVSIGSKLVEAKLSGYGWVFIATLAAVGLHVATSLFIPNGLAGLSVAAVGSIFIYSYALGTTLPKATGVYCISVLSLILVAVVAVMAFGGRANIHLFAYHFTVYRNDRMELADSRSGARFSAAHLERSDGIGRTCEVYRAVKYFVAKFKNAFQSVHGAVWPPV